MKKYIIEVYNCHDHIAVYAYMINPKLNGKDRLPRPLSSFRSSIFDIYKKQNRYDIYDSTIIEKLLGFSIEKRLEIAINNCKKWIENQEKKRKDIINVLNNLEYEK